MKLDQILRECRTPIADRGFTDQVMMRIPASESWLTRLDLSALETLAYALALFITSIYLSPHATEFLKISLPGSVAAVGTGMGALTLFAIGGALAMAEVPQ